MATVKLEIVSPDQMVYSADIAMLIARTTAGEIGVLPKHAPLVAALRPHAMRVKLGGESEEQLIAVSDGFIEVTPDKIAVIVGAAEEPLNIDVNRAQKAYARAKERIERFHQSGEANVDIDIIRAELALQRAMARLVATKTKYE